MRSLYEIFVKLLMYELCKEYKLKSFGLSFIPNAGYSIQYIKYDYKM